MLLKYLKVLNNFLFLNKVSFTFLAFLLYTYGHSIKLSKLSSFLFKKSILMQNLVFFEEPKELQFLNLFILGIRPCINTYFAINLLKSYFFIDTIENKFTKNISIFIKSNIFFTFLFLSFSVIQFYFLSKNITIDLIKKSLNLKIYLAIAIFGSVLAKKISNWIDLYGIGRGVTLLFLIDTGFISLKNLFFLQIISFTQFKIFCFLTIFLLPLHLITQTIKVKTAKVFDEDLKFKPLTSDSSYSLQLKFSQHSTYPLILTSNLITLLKLFFNFDKKIWFIYYYSLLYCCVFAFYFFSFNLEQIIDYFQQKTILVFKNSTILSQNDQIKTFLIKKNFKFITFFSFFFILNVLIKDYLISLLFSAKILEIYFFNFFSFDLILSFLIEIFSLLQIIYSENKLILLTLSLNW